MTGDNLQHTVSCMGRDCEHLGLVVAWMELLLTQAGWFGDDMDVPGAASLMLEAMFMITSKREVMFKHPQR